MGPETPMRRCSRTALLLLTAVALSGCALISATGEFVVKNQTSYPISVGWTADGTEGGPVPIAVGEVAEIASQRYLEADEVPPSYYLSELWAIVGVTEAYVQNPIDDSRWVKADSGFRTHTWTLTLNDIDLTLP